MSLFMNMKKYEFVSSDEARIIGDRKKVHQYWTTFLQSFAWDRFITLTNEFNGIPPLDYYISRLQQRSTAEGVLLCCRGNYRA